MDSLRASPVFALAVLITLGLTGLNGLMVLLMQLQPGFMGMAHFTEEHHRVHDLAFGFIFLPAVIGMLAQLRRPSENVAGQVMALIPWAGLGLTFLLTAVLTSNTRVLQLVWIGPAASTLVAAILHPTWRGFFRSFSGSRVSWALLALVGVAAVPLLAFASTNIRLQGTVPDDHGQLGHYGFMAALAFTAVGVGLLASLRPDGWRLTAWVAGVLAVLLGLASLVYPDVTSSLGPVWSLAAIAWGALFVAAAERTRLADPAPAPSAAVDSSAGPSRTSATGTPRWVQASGVVVLALVLLVIGMFLTGTSPGGLGHTPPVGGHR